MSEKMSVKHSSNVGWTGELNKIQANIDLFVQKKTELLP